MDIKFKLDSDEDDYNELLFDNYINDKYKNFIMNERESNILSFINEEARTNKSETIISPFKITYVEKCELRGVGCDSEGCYLFHRYNNGLLYMKEIINGRFIVGSLDIIIGIDDFSLFSKYHNLDDETASLIKLYLQINDNQITVDDFYEKFSWIKNFKTKIEQ